MKCDLGMIDSGLGQCGGGGGGGGNCGGCGGSGDEFRRRVARACVEACEGRGVLGKCVLEACVGSREGRRVVEGVSQCV